MSLTEEQRAARIAQLTTEITNYTAAIEKATLSQSYAAPGRSKTMANLETLVKLRDKAQAEKNALENETTNPGSGGIQFVVGVPRDH